MSELKVKEKEVAVPGEVLATGMEYLPSYGTYREGESIRAAKLGLVQIDGKVIKLVPLNGRYIPKRGDTVLVRVTDVISMGWRVVLNTSHSALIPLREGSEGYIEKGADLARIYGIDDYLVGKISNVSAQKLIDVSMKGPGARKLRGGRIIDVNPYRVPRIIGKAGSMVSMIKNATKSQIVVGQNGWAWINADDHKMEVLAVEAIRKVENEAHTTGLTDKIKAFLEKETGTKIVIERSE